VVALLAGGPGASHAAGAPLAAQSVSGLPQPDHVVIVMEENHGFAGVFGSAATPYLNSLARRGAVFTNSHALTHPSQPNYLALYDRR
jgi:arylsulfatase A-like enzyme